MDIETRTPERARHRNARLSAVTVALWAVVVALAVFSLVVI
ncbi:hypothetical protein ACFOVU_22285 [Nocardiopsis sediminis]|uniref:Uncharacterized protein n=1 Tax=Nocardiopsis sediminis TaxID=1778267 RepID=A0ABV8FVF9_9ACTN